MYVNDRGRPFKIEFQIGAAPDFLKWPKRLHLDGPAGLPAAHALRREHRPDASGQGRRCHAARVRTTHLGDAEQRPQVGRWEHDDYVIQQFLDPEARPCRWIRGSLRRRTHKIASGQTRQQDRAAGRPAGRSRPTVAGTPARPAPRTICTKVVQCRPTPAVSLDLLATPVAWADADGRLLGGNPAFASWLGISPRAPPGAAAGGAGGRGRVAGAPARRALAARFRAACGGCRWRFPGSDAPRFADVSLTRAGRRLAGGGASGRGVPRRGSGAGAAVGACPPR